MMDSQAHRRVPLVLGVAAAVLALLTLVLTLAPSVDAAKQNPTFQFKSGTFSIDENQSPAQILINRNPKGPGSVNFNTAGGTATAGPDCTDPNTDYVAVSPPVTVGPFSNNVSQRSTPVVICNNNNLYEGTETVLLQLSSPVGASLANGKSQATLQIHDDDPKPSLSINDRMGTEGVSRNFTVTASSAALVPMSVTLTAVSDTATVGAGQDAEPQTHTVTIPVGDTSVQQQFTSNDDTIDELTEKYRVVMSSPVNATIGDGSGDFTLTDDDVPVANVADATVEEGGVLDFVVTLDQAPAETVTLDYSTFSGTATGHPVVDDVDCGDDPPGDADYEAKDQTVTPLTFAPGDTSETVSVQTCEDVFYEGDETNTLTVSNPTNGALGDATGTGTIEGDGDSVVVYSGGGDSIPDEGTGQSTINVAAPSGATTVQDVNVEILGYSHGAPSDTNWTLTNPSATTGLIFGHVGGLTDISGIDVTIDDEAAAAYACGGNFFTDPPLTPGSYKPTGCPAFDAVAMSSFDGGSPYGDWTLAVADTFANNDGSFTGWELTLTLDVAD